MSVTVDEVSVRDDPQESRYEVVIGGIVAGFSDYVLGEHEITFVHTEVLPEFSGRGLAGRLAAGALGDARRRGLAVIPECPFIRRYIRKHPDYAALVPADRRAEFRL
jgi:uncharacterized protein